MLLLRICILFLKIKNAMVKHVKHKNMKIKSTSFISNVRDLQIYICFEWYVECSINIISQVIHRLQTTINSCYLSCLFKATYVLTKYKFAHQTVADSAN